MVRETNWRGVQDLTISDSADDLLSALAVWELPLHDNAPGSLWPWAVATFWWEMTPADSV